MANYVYVSAYKKTLQSASSGAIVEKYRENRKQKIRLFGGKKRKYGSREREEIEMHGCRNENEKLVTDPQGVVKL